MRDKISLASLKTEVLSGLTVAIALVPEAVAFAFVAGVHPLVGLYAAFLIGLVTSIFGGRPGMISGATGALAVVMTSLVAQHGVEYLFATVVLMGVLQMLAGLLKLGRFIRIVPHSVMLGFVNGLAIVIFLAQLTQFKTPDASGVLVWLEGIQLWTMLGLVGLTMGIIFFWPKLSKAVPAPLVAIVAVFGFTYFVGIDTKHVGDMASIAGSLPDFHLPIVPFTYDTLKIIFPYAVILAMIGLIESLLAMTLIDEITETKGQNSRECLAQGFANVLTGLFGGMGGCAMIGQSMINISSGARKRISGIVAALFLLSFILFGAPLIEMIPIAALVGVMFMVVIGTFAWSSLRIMTKIPLTDAMVIVVVSTVTVFYDLAIAVFVGVIISALAYAWKSARHLWAEVNVDDKTGTKVYALHGMLFFGSIKSFNDLFDPRKDLDDVIVDFDHCRLWDHSALEALVKLSARYAQVGKKLTFKRLSRNCADLLERAGCQVERDATNDPKYGVILEGAPLHKLKVKPAV